MSNGWKIGFLDISGSALVDIERCEIMEETINEKMRVLRENKQLRRNTDAQSDNLVRFSLSIRLTKRINCQDSERKNFLVPRDGFFQANLYLTDRLVDEVCRLVMPEKINTIVDAYCGSGLFSIFLSSFAKNVIGIEINEKSVKHAQINAENAGVKNVKFIYGDIENVLRRNFYRREIKSI